MLLILGNISNNDDVCVEGFFCEKDNLCINNRFVCDGQRHCSDGQDESLDECRKRNIFPKAATVICNETDRPDDFWIEIMAIRCNGQGTIHILRKHILTPYLSALDFCNTPVWSNKFDKLDFFHSLNWIFLPTVACKIQVWNRLKIKFIKLVISKWRIAKIKCR